MDQQTRTVGPPTAIEWLPASVDPDDRLHVRDLMSPRPVTTPLDTPLSRVRQLMVERHVRHLPVVDGDGVLHGLITHRDLLATQAGLPGHDDPPVGDLARRRIIAVREDASARTAARHMLTSQKGCVPVVDPSSHRLVGILTEADFLRHVLRAG